MQKLTATLQTGSKSINKRVTVTIGMVVVSGLLLGLGAISMNHRASSGSPAPAPVAGEEAFPQPRLRAMAQIELGEQIIMTQTGAATVARQAAAYQEFKGELAVATQELEALDAGINGIVERLTSLQGCLSLTYLMAKDFFTGGSEVDKIFIAELEELDRLTGNSVDLAKQALDRLQAALNMTQENYTASYIAGPETSSVAEEGIADAAAQDRGQLELTKAISLASSRGSAAALVSATALAKTVNRRAWNPLGAVKKNAIKRMAVAALPAMADGPLPVGDMVALALESGCLAWSFHDVYAAQGAMKSDLQGELTGVMAQNSKQIRAWAMGVGSELMETAAVSMPASKIKIVAKVHPRK